MGWKRKFYKLVFAGPMQTVGHGVDSSPGPAEIPHPTWSIFFADMSGDAPFQEQALCLNSLGS